MTEHTNTKRHRIIALCWASLFLLGIIVTLYFRFTAKSADHRYRIGAAYMTMNNPFYEVIDDELQLITQSRGDLLLVRDSSMSQQRQNEEIFDLLAEDIDLLIVNPVNSSAIAPALEQAALNGVPVIALDNSVADPSLVQCTITSNNYQAGVLCAQDLMHRRSEADIYLLEHSTAISAAQRMIGFVDTIADHPNYRIVARTNCDRQLENAMPATKRLLTSRASANVIFALNDPSALGALGALEDAGRSGTMLVYGVDGTPEAKGLIQDGMMTATVAQFVYQMSETLGETAYDILEGKDVCAEIIIPVQLITQENVEEYGTDGWQ